MSRRSHAFTPFVTLLMAACVDTTPIHVDETRVPVSDAGTTAECVQCIEGEGQPCRSAYDLCQSVPDCPLFHACVVELGCYMLPALEDRIPCGQSCIELINLTSTHPGLPGVLAMNDCTQEACRAQCVKE
jgi:hypothetical protein